MEEKKPKIILGKSMPLWLKALIFAVIATSLTVALKKCIFDKKEKKPVNQALWDGIKKRASDPVNVASVDSGVRILKTGDLVMRRGGDATSAMLCLLNQQEKFYSHCGLVVVENGYPFIYHSIGGEDNPNERMQRDSAGKWFSPANNLGFGIARLDVPEEKKGSIANVVRDFYKKGLRFDMKFDINTDDRLYCAEMVYKAVDKALNDPGYFQPISIWGHRFIGIDNLYLSKHAQLICQVRFK